jgi:transcriptional regulator with XRE-family HTH domain
MGRIQEALSCIVAQQKELGVITQKKLAKSVGCSQSMISDLLNGEKRLSDAWIERICDAIGITLSDLDWKDRKETVAQKANRELHQYFDAILVNGGDRANWISGNVITFYSEMTGKKPDLSLAVNGEAKQVPTEIPEPIVKVTHRTKK